MIDLNPYVVFAEVVAAGSMSAAARKLGTTPSAVSQAIGNLERRTGVTLLHRSTRRLSLTEAGERCYPYSVQLLEAGRSAVASLEQARDAPSGELRIAAPVGFGAHVAPALAPVLAEWPQLRLRLIVDDALVDLVEHRIDLALRVGWHDDGVWDTGPLGDLDACLCAAPAYLARRGVPTSSGELAEHDWIGLARGTSVVSTASRDDPDEHDLFMSDGSGAPTRVKLRWRITASSQIAVQQLCEQALGLACVFVADVRPAIERGALTAVLPSWRLPSSPITMLTPRRPNEPAKVRVAKAAFERYFARQPSRGGTATTPLG